MTQQNPIQKKIDDFSIAVIIHIEGHNSRALVLRIAGIAAAIIAVAVKVALLFMARAP
jgi:hypothetical protein